MYNDENAMAMHMHMYMRMGVDELNSHQRRQIVQNCCSRVGPGAAGPLAMDTRICLVDAKCSLVLDQ